MLFYVLLTVLWTTGSCGVTSMRDELSSQDDNPSAEKSFDQDRINFQPPDQNGFKMDGFHWETPNEDTADYEPDWKKFTVDTDWKKFTPPSFNFDNMDLDKIEVITITWEVPRSRSSYSGNGTIFAIIPIIMVVLFLLRKCCLSRNTNNSEALANLTNRPTVVNSSSAGTENSRVALIVVTTRLGDNNDSASRRDETDKPPDYFDVVSANSREGQVQFPEARSTHPVFPPPSYDEHVRENRQN